MIKYQSVALVLCAVAIVSGCVSKGTAQRQADRAASSAFRDASSHYQSHIAQMDRLVKSERATAAKLGQEVQWLRDRNQALITTMRQFASTDPCVDLRELPNGGITLRRNYQCFQ